MINLIDHVINIDFSRNINFINGIRIKNGDGKSHRLVINLFENSVGFDVTGLSSKIFFEKQDGTKSFQNCTIDSAVNGNLSCVLTSQTLACPGVVQAEMTLYGTENEVLTSVTFSFIVLACIRDDSVIESANEFSALTEALVKVNNWDQQFQQKYNGLETQYAADLTAVKSQLAEKANQDEVRIKSILINELDISDSLKQQINGNAPILQTIADKVINPRKTTFIKSVNLFDKDAVVAGNISSYDGHVITDSNNKTSDFIKVTPSATLNASQTISGYAFFDANMSFISATVGVAVTQITMPSNAYYTRIYCTNARADLMMMVENQVLPAVYTPYKLILDKSLITDLTRDNLGSVLWNLQDFAIASTKNLFDLTKATIDKYVNQVDGTLAVNTSYYASDYIPIDSNTQYTRSDDKRTAFYDANKVFISGHYDASSNTKTITTPANAKYMRCSVLKTNVTTFQIEKGNIQTEYEPYGYKIDSSYIRGIEQPPTVEINLPSKLYVVNGKKLNIYFDNIIKNAKNYNLDIVSSKGIHYEKKWELTSDFNGDLSITLQVYKNEKFINSKLVTIKSVALTNGTGTKKGLFIGDSTTDAGKYTQALLDLFNGDTMSLQLLGTRGVAPNLHEGRGGWTATGYVVNSSISGVTNAFYNSAVSQFDFNYYMTQQDYTSVDYVFIHLGINDIFAFNTVDEAKAGIPAILDKFDTMINSIKAYNASVKIGLMVTIPPNASQDAFGTTYLSSQTRWRYYAVYQEWLKEFIAKYDSREVENIYLVPIHTNVDSESGFGGSVQTPAVHPNDTGYSQMANPIYYFIKNIG